MTATTRAIAAAALTAAALAFPTAAGAESPANDDIAQARVLAGPSPIKATGTTAGATWESWEPGPDENYPPIENGGSVWYRWSPEVSSYGWVQVDSCIDHGWPSEFRVRLSVYSQARSGGPLELVYADNFNCGAGMSFERAGGLRADRTYWFGIEPWWQGTPGGFDVEIVHWPDETIDGGIDGYTCLGRQATIVDSFRGGPNNGTVHGTAGNDVIVMRGNGMAFAGPGDDLVCRFAEGMVWAGEGDDVLIGSPEGDSLYGEGGDDRIVGGGGSDDIRGDGGTDLLVGGDGYDEIAGGFASDFLQGGKGRDELDGGGDEDRIEGSLGHDQLVGRAGNDQLDGGDGFDRIEGLAGHDEIVGYKGNDNLAGGDGDDDFSGGGGFDRCTLEEAEQPVGCERQKSESFG